MHENLSAACGTGGITEYHPRGFLIGFVPLPNGDSSATNFAFGGENNQYTYMERAVSGTTYKFKAPYPGLIGPDGVRMERSTLMCDCRSDGCKVVDLALCPSDSSTSGG